MRGPLECLILLSNINSIPESIQPHLYRCVDENEIKIVFLYLKANKAPGPDVYSIGFFKKDWSFVGIDVMLAVKAFFRPCSLHRTVNSIIISLVSKIPNLSRIGTIRPIPCCHTIYKCISKIVANRIKAVLPNLIDPVHSAFVQGRRIADNVLLSIIETLRALDVL